MKNRKQSVLVLGMTIGLSILTSISAFAGKWVKGSYGWWYKNDDGSYPTDTWEWIDGNKDGIAECYYFDSLGYIVTNDSVDDYQLNQNGAWVINGKVQTKEMNVELPSQIDTLTGIYTLKYYDIDSEGRTYVNSSNEKLYIVLNGEDMTVWTNTSTISIPAIFSKAEEGHYADLGGKGDWHIFEFDNGMVGLASGEEIDYYEKD